MSTCDYCGEDYDPDIEGLDDAICMACAIVDIEATEDSECPGCGGVMEEGSQGDSGFCPDCE